MFWPRCKRIFWGFAWTFAASNAFGMASAGLGLLGPKASVPLERLILFVMLPSYLVGIWAYHALGPEPLGDGFTHCGKCGYILKGLSEPRCPECGERL